MSDKPKRQSQGALWKRTNDYGEFLSGQIEIDGKKFNFRAYLNQYKKEEKQPDYRIFLDEPKARATAKADFKPMDVSDIPF